MLTKEHIENLDKKMHNLASKIGSKAGEVFKLLKEKGTVTHERIEESPSRIDKLEEILSNLSSDFASVKTIEKTPVKISKITQATKNKGATSNINKEDLKMISIHPDFIEVVRNPTCKNEFFNLIPRSIVIENIYAKSLRNNVVLLRSWKLKMITLKLCIMPS